MFQQGDIIWAKTNDYPLWPCIITKNLYEEVDEEMYYGIRFLGETSKTIIQEENALEFDMNRPEFTPTASVLKKFKTLKKGLLEAAKKVKDKASIVQKSPPRIQQQKKKDKGIFNIKKKDRKQKHKSPSPSEQEQPEANQSPSSRNSHKSPKLKPLKSPNISPSPRERLRFPQSPQSNSLHQRYQSPIHRIRNESYQLNQSHKSETPQRELKESANRNSNFVLQQQISPQSQELKQQAIKQEQGQQSPLPSPVDVSPIPHHQYSEDKQSLQELIDAGKFQVEIQEPLPKSLTNSVMKNSNKYPINSLQDALPHKPSKKQRIQEKKEQKQEYRVEGLEKTLAYYIAMQKRENISNEEKRVHEMKFKLEVITFLLLDDSPNIQPIRIKVEEFKGLFNLEKIPIKEIMETKLSSILSFIVSRLPRSFSAEIEWFQSIINSINQRVIKHINSFHLLDDIMEWKTNLSKPKEDTTSKGNNPREASRQKQEHQQPQQPQSPQQPPDSLSRKSKNSSKLKPNQIQYYKEQISKLISLNIIQITTEQHDQLSKLLLQYLCKQKKRIEAAWQALKEKIRRSRSKTGAECLKTMASYVNSLP